MDSQELRNLSEAYLEVYQVDEAKVDKLKPEHERASARDKRYDNPEGALELGGGVRRARRIAHRERDEMNKDAKDIRRGKLSGPQFQGKTGAERIAQVKKAKGIDEATAMAKRGLDEPAIRQQIAKSTGGGEAADRASALEKKSTFGDAKKAKARQELARKQRGDFRSTTSSSPGLHGYAHKSDDPAVKAKQAARGAQRSALTPAEKKQLNREEFDLYDIILSHLLDEGYADTEKAAQVIMTNMSEEWKDSIVEGRSDRPLGLMHPFARGMKQKKGEKREEKYRQDSEGNLTGKYAEMQRSKRGS